MSLTAIINTQSSGLNMRMLPNSSASVIKVIPKGATVYVSTIMRNSDPVNWEAVEYAGQSGYVAKSYLKYNEPTTPTTTNSIPVTTGTNSQFNTNNQNTSSTMAATMTEATKKKLKIGLVVVGVVAAGALAYSMSKKKANLSTTNTSGSLNGVKKSTKKCKKSKTQKKRKISKSKAQKKISLK